MKRSDTSLMILGGLFSAATLLMLHIASITPSGRAGCLAISSFFPFILGYVGNVRAGFSCWLATSILAFLVVPSKTIALMYAFCFGLYPLFRFWLENRTKKLPLFLFKLCYANSSFLLFLVLFQELFFSSLPEILQNYLILFLLGGNAIFLAYDYGLSRLFPLIKSKLQAFMQQEVPYG